MRAFRDGRISEGEKQEAIEEYRTAFLQFLDSHPEKKHELQELTRLTDEEIRREKETAARRRTGQYGDSQRHKGSDRGR